MKGKLKRNILTADDGTQVHTESSLLGLEDDTFDSDGAPLGQVDGFADTEGFKLGLTDG